MDILKDLAKGVYDLRLLFEGAGQELLEVIEGLLWIGCFSVTAFVGYALIRAGWETYLENQNP